VGGALLFQHYLIQAASAENGVTEVRLRFSCRGTLACMLTKETVDLPANEDGASSLQIVKLDKLRQRQGGFN
jgi:hypothetical protein